MEAFLLTPPHKSSVIRLNKSIFVRLIYLNICILLKNKYFQNNCLKQESFVLYTQATIVEEAKNAKQYNPEGGLSRVIYLLVFSCERVSMGDTQRQPFTDG